MEDVHGRCVDVVVMMLYTGWWGGWGGGDVNVQWKTSMEDDDMLKIMRRLRC